jgi:hypothetical protein
VFVAGTAPTGYSISSTVVETDSSAAAGSLTMLFGVSRTETGYANVDTNDNVTAISKNRSKLGRNKPTVLHTPKGVVWVLAVSSFIVAVSLETEDNEEDAVALLNKVCNLLDNNVVFLVSAEKRRGVSITSDSTDVTDAESNADDEAVAQAKIEQRVKEEDRLIEELTVFFGDSKAPEDSGGAADVCTVC